MTGSNDYSQTDLARLMEQQGRQLLEARMLPNEGPLTEDQRQSIRQAVQAYMKKHVVSSRDIARQMGGISNPTICQVLKNTYKTSKTKLDEHLRAMNDWLEIDARRRQVKPSGRFVETRVARRIIQCAEQALRRKFIALAHGPTGIGKTMVAHVLAERFVGAIYIRVSKGNTTHVAIRKMLASRLRLGGSKRKKIDHTLTFDERIFDKLRDSHRLIIIDEAHRLGDSGLEFLRDVFDECQVPMLLLSTKDLLDRIRRDSDEDHGQQRSRIGWFCELTHDGGGDSDHDSRRPLFTIAEIRKLFEEPGKVRLLPDAQGYLQQVANMLGHGSLRLCRDILAWAIAIERSVKGLSATDPVTITEKLLVEAETQSRSDKSILHDMSHRRGVIKATA